MDANPLAAARAAAAALATRQARSDSSGSAAAPIAVDLSAAKAAAAALAACNAGESLTMASKRPAPFTAFDLGLHDAVKRHDLPRLKHLVDAGASLTVVDHDNRNPLHLAAIASSREMATMLLSSSADFERIDALFTHDDDGYSPVHLAATCGDGKLMGALLSSVDAEIVDDLLQARSHLRGELFEGNWGKKTADGRLEELDVEHMSPLHLALERLCPSDEDEDEGGSEEKHPSETARAEAVEMVRLLIEYGADVNARDANGRTPIHQAVGAGLQDMTELLLEAGADPALGCKDIGMANTVLHQAVLQSDEQMVRVLVRAAPHLSVDVEGRNGLTPLCLAARSNKVACARALIEAGADPKVVTAFGKSALDIAKTNNRAAILQLFGEASSVP